MNVLLDMQVGRNKDVTSVHSVWQLGRMNRRRYPASCACPWTGTCGPVSPPEGGSWPCCRISLPQPGGETLPDTVGPPHAAERLLKCSNLLVIFKIHICCRIWSEPEKAAVVHSTLLPTLLSFLKLFPVFWSPLFFFVFSTISCP